jgi:NAD(P)-dependent dehydrogenase (short-subunit alcohol dehydrogenase family)
MEKERRALVVGNSDGIGFALTRRLLAAGWTVTGVSRRASVLADPRYEHAVTDVASTGYHGELDEIQHRRGPFELCVYCAGIGEPFDEAELARAAQVMRVNLVGATETATVVIPPMLRAGRGQFVALSSIGDTASAAAPSYSASKAGLSSWLGGLALALRSQGVHVTNVRLGFVDTKMAKSKVRPMIISVERAVDVVLECLQHKPARKTYPLAMQWLVTLFAFITTVRLWFS